jgi:hypothetical protein
LTPHDLCSICNKRRAERYCPAEGEKICAIECGTGREVTIDCPSDCGYLVAAHRWEEAHPKSIAQRELPFPDVSFPASLVHIHEALLSGIGYTAVSFAQEQPASTDGDVFSAAQAIAETYRALTAGIYFEKPPEGLVATGLYAALAKFLEEEKKREGDHPQAPRPKDSEIFHVLVFFLRFGILRSNSRPRTRMFLQFLREQMPPEMDVPKQESRIILP